MKRAKRNRTQGNQVKQTKAIAHHELTDAQAVPPCQLFLLVSTLEHDTIWSGIASGSLRVSCPGSVPSQYTVHPQPPHWWGEAEKPC